MTRKKEVRRTTVRKSEDAIHIETDGCIVSIYPGLFRTLPGTGEKVTAIEVIPDRNTDRGKWGILKDDETVKYEGEKIRVIRRD